MKKEIIQQIREKKPLIHCICNIVTANDCANILLALGASPTMAHHPLEMEDITSKCSALVCNLGASESYEAMKIAYEIAAKQNIPIVIDPVGTGGSKFRRKMLREFINIASPTCVRGNFSEIAAIASMKDTTAGVDANEDEIMHNEKERIVMKVAQTLQCIVVASGKIDIVSDGKSVRNITAGDKMMTKVTGTGCMSSVVIGAFLAENIYNKTESNFELIYQACDFIGKCGEIAEKSTKMCNGGTMDFRNNFINTVYKY